MKRLCLIAIVWIIVPSVQAKTYIRDYTYNATELDTIETCRIVSFDQIKLILLSEIGVHIRHKLSLKKDSDGNEYATEDVEAITAGLTKVEMLEEKWNGKIYYLKAKIEADTGRVLNALEVFKNQESEKNKQKIEELKANRRKLKVAREEVIQLRNQLVRISSKKENEKIAIRYNKQIEQISISDMYVRGYNNEQQGLFEEAVHWYRKAAERGDALSQTSLGLMYKYGFGLKEDIALAVYWYHKAAKKEYAPAQYKLAYMYNECDSIIVDIPLAAYWFRKAAGQGYASAQRSLGHMYEYGHGTPLLCGTSKSVKKNYPLAVHWYLKAAEQGDTSSQISLAWMYRKGIGVKQDKKIADSWYKKACESGAIRACSPYRKLVIKKNN